MLRNDSLIWCSRIEQYDKPFPWRQSIIKLWWFLSIWHFRFFSETVHCLAAWQKRTFSPSLNSLLFHFSFFPCFWFLSLRQTLFIFSSIFVRLLELSGNCHQRQDPFLFEARYLTRSSEPDHTFSHFWRNALTDDITALELRRRLRSSDVSCSFVSWHMDLT